MMTEELTKKAVDMLLKGATLLSEPCPYCKGVRVMKDGSALCVNCGREPESEKPGESKIQGVSSSSDALKIFEGKLEQLSKELEKEPDYEKQQSILKSINSILETIEKLKQQK